MQRPRTTEVNLLGGTRDTYDPLRAGRHLWLGCFPSIVAESGENGLWYFHWARSLD